jgi:NTE family protein
MTPAAVPSSTPLRIAISLGASFLGYATHAGFLARLHELGVRPVAVSGSSAGAIAAGLYAAGVDPVLIRETLTSNRMRHAFASGTRWWRHYPKVVFNSAHVSAMHPGGAVALLDNLVGGKRIEDLHAPSFFAAVTDLEACRATFLHEGSLAAAMVASCCVPTLIAPLEHAGMLCFDGGIAHETPVDPWLDDPGIDIIIAHRISHPPSAPSKLFPFNIFNTPGRVMACAGEQLLEYRRRLAAFHGKALLIAHTYHQRPSMISSRKLRAYYAEGEAQAQRFYEEQLQGLLTQVVHDSNLRPAG